jgi:hypothetical protein
MSRAAVAGVVLISIALASCSGTGAAQPFAKKPACALLAELAQTGQTVQNADVSDPAAFQATLQAAAKRYVRTAQKLRAALPARLAADVDRMISAVRANRFSDADSARADIDAYARANCKTAI